MSTWRIQSLRFVIVGLASNLVLYLLYLTLTTFGLGHKTAMTLLYPVGTLQTFFFNQRWTFKYHGHIQKSMLRYFTVYGACYFFNLALLYTFADHFGWPHAWIQGFAIPIVATLLFLAQKYWVFRGNGNNSVQAGGIA